MNISKTTTTPITFTISITFATSTTPTTPLISKAAK
jgi:hypothetical protein